MSPLTSALVAKIAQMGGSDSEPLVIFDLDGTLYNNTPRTLRILQEYAHLVASKHRDFAKKVDAISSAQLQYKVSDTLRAAGVDSDELIAEAFAYWRERFFTDDYVFHDLPLAGAVEFVRHVYDAGGVPVYLTGRDAPNMLIGTIRSLQRDGFPVGTVDTRMILKDDWDRPDKEYKASVVAHLRRTGNVVAAFDNEPGLCNLFKESFPDASVFWLDTSHAPGAPSLRDDVHTIEDFASLLP